MTARRYHSGPDPSMDAPGMTLPAAPPLGFVAVPIPKALLLLTEAEYVRGIRRGKWWKRTQAEAQRAAEVIGCTRFRGGSYSVTSRMEDPALGTRSRSCTRSASIKKLSRMTRTASFLLSNFARKHNTAVAQMTRINQNVGEVGRMTAHPPSPPPDGMICMRDSTKRARRFSNT